jgi:TorA maturation chaperone TorD
MSSTQSPTQADAAAQRITASALAAALSDPAAAPRADVSAGPVLGAAWAVLAGPGVQQAELGLGELPPGRVDPAPLAAWLAEPPETRSAVFREVFGLIVSRECPPYETEYCPSRDATHRAHHMADIAGFYRAFGVRPGTDRPERPDHVAMELAFVSLLLRKLELLAGEGGAGRHGPEHDVCARALADFLRDHICWWIPTFARCVQRRIEGFGPLGNSREARAMDHLRGVCDILRAWTAAQRLAAGVEPVRRIVEPAVFIFDPADDACLTCGPCDKAPD